jgi:integrase
VPRRGENIQRVVESRTRADGSTYEIVRWRTWVDLGINPVTGKRERTVVSADTYGGAKKERRDLLAKRDRGLTPTSAKGWTVATWCRHWVDTVIKPEMDEGTYVSYSGDVKNSIVPSPIGRKALAKVQPSDVNAWKAWLQEERHLAPSTRRRCLTVLRKALKEAKRQLLVADNVASTDFVDGIAVPKKEPKALSQRQVHQLLAQSRHDEDRNYAMYLLAFQTGLRQGELLGLKWAADETEPGLDLERGVIRVRQQLTRYRGPAKIVNRVKRNSIRDAYLSAELVEVLRQHRVELLKDQLRAGSRWRENGLVFPTRYGTPQRNTNAWLGFKRLLKRAGLPTDFTFHNQRSTAASVAIADGATLWEVSKMLGHKDIRTTANQYGHLFPETQREMAERMSRLILSQALPAANKQ